MVSIYWATSTTMYVIFLIHTITLRGSNYHFNKWGSERLKRLRTFPYATELLSRKLRWAQSWFMSKSHSILWNHAVSTLPHTHHMPSSCVETLLAFDFRPSHLTLYPATPSTRATNSSGKTIPPLSVLFLWDSSGWARGFFSGWRSLVIVHYSMHPSCTLHLIAYIN